MGKKPKVEKSVLAEDLVPVSNSAQPNQDLTPIFDLAIMESQTNRHKSINNLFDKAAEVISNFLDDPSVEPISKMLPAKMAIDIYTSQEKFKREDERIGIEKRKLLIEEKKANMPSLPGATFNQQNNYISMSQTNMAEIKKKQDELLASFRSKTPVKTDDN